MLAHRLKTSFLAPFFFRRFAVAVHEAIMGSPVDLTLGCNTEGHGRINGATLDYKNGFSAYPRGAENLESLEEQLRTLKEERRKVEGFKRELPFCIELLEDGKLMEAS